MCSIANKEDQWLCLQAAKEDVEVIGSAHNASHASTLLMQLAVFQKGDAFLGPASDAKPTPGPSPGSPAADPKSPAKQPARALQTSSRSGVTPQKGEASCLVWPKPTAGPQTHCKILNTDMFHIVLLSSSWLSQTGTTKVSSFCIPNIQGGLVRRPRGPERTSKSPGSRSCTTCTPGTKRSTTGARASSAPRRGSCSKTSATMCAHLKCSCLTSFKG